MDFEFPQKVLFKHCDPAGIVFYPRYFEMLNDCVEAFFDHIGFPFEDMHRHGGVPTVQIDTVFYAPSKHGDHLTLFLHATKLGNSSLGLSFEVFCGDEKRLSARSTLVNINQHTRPQNWSDPMRSALAPYVRKAT